MALIAVLVETLNVYARSKRVQKAASNLWSEFFKENAKLQAAASCKTPAKQKAAKPPKMPTDSMRPWNGYYKNSLTDSLMFMLVSTKALETGEARGDQRGLTRAYTLQQIEEALTAECITDKQLKKARKGQSASVSGQPAKLTCSDKTLVFFCSDEVSASLFKEESGFNSAVYFRGAVDKNADGQFMTVVVERDIATGAFVLPPVSALFRRFGNLSEAAKAERCARLCHGMTCRYACGREKK